MKLTIKKLKYEKYKYQRGQLCGSLGCQFQLLAGEEDLQFLSSLLRKVLGIFVLYIYLFIYLFTYLSFFAVPRPFPHFTESLLFPAAFIVKQLLKFRLLVGFKGGGRV